jgi:acyl-CoA synthetase (AMP-forming)/AMP-acid ligase II
VNPAEGSSVNRPCGTSANRLADAGLSRRDAGKGGKAPVAFAGQALRTLVATGVLRPLGPRTLARIGGIIRRYGAALPTMAAIAAVRHADQVAVVDERGTLTFAELWSQAQAVAGALHSEHGLRRRTRLGIMCRNHAGFAVATIAGATAGADLVFLNTDFAGPQLAEVLRREKVEVAIHDEEFSPAFEAAFTGVRVLAWTEAPSDLPTLEGLAATGGPAPPTSRAPSRIVILTSGTTGTPRGAPRDVEPLALAIPAIGMVDAMGLRGGDPLVVLPPLFHGFGLAYWTLALALGSPLVLRRRFDPEATLALVAEHRAAALFGVPVMLQRLLALPDDVRGRYDTVSLKAVGSSGASLRPELGTRFMDVYGDILFNLYGSTETGWSTYATPADLRAAPGTVGPPAQGITLQVLDDDGARVPPGTPGLLHVRSPLTFGGYSGGGGKAVVRGLMSTGDLGHVDEAGRVFVDGREDDMIVSGGENVFPQEVEELLAGHHSVADVAVFGVPDEEFGQRLAAWVIPVRQVEPPGEEVLADVLRAHVRTNLARYKVPRDVRFVTELPRNATGKVLTRRLKSS